MILGTMMSLSAQHCDKGQMSWPVLSVLNAYTMEALSTLALWVQRLCMLVLSYRPFIGHCMMQQYSTGT